ncbi:uncharacterized protein At4g22758-like isoform X1 [Syzygium oleosum]|uniref:uncharacterized protein At4g22758-like isoform X1 n=1 Tax=Syzygium oleosum TaxID=219896 RepID=UPI0024BA3981|nr:uncharacterized protein At4g22758-like isoform X1 [Syzygium oleosum]XP_056173514.1 uncharacterized protein At4g22758-like isoform X1 [Syzygium oleosum]
MSERRAHRRQAAVSGGGRSSRPPQPSPPAARRSSFKHLRPAKRLERCSSEPSLWNSAEDLVGDGPGDLRQSVSSNDGALFSPLSCTDVLASSPSLMGSSSPGGLEVKGYNKEAKVVVNVTVEGSVGPIRMMVKLGSSVEDTIKLVMNKYKEERRMPKIDRDRSTGFELHHSYFSLQSLDKSKLLGDVGSRSFYLRRTTTGLDNSGFSASFVSDKAATVRTSSPPSPPLFFLFTTFIARKLAKIMRRAHKLWRIIICSQQD